MGIISVLLPFLIFPAAYFWVIGRLLFNRDPRGVAFSLLVFALAVATALWAIFQSRSSTAGIGILGVPFIGALGGFLGLGFARWRSSAETGKRIGGWVAGAAAVVMFMWNVGEGMKTRRKNDVRDAAQEAHSAAIARNRELIAAEVTRNPAGQRQYIDSAIRARMNDRAFMIAALDNDSVSPGVLDTVANSPDIGVVLQALRNPNTSAATLTRVYRTSTYPDYFYQSLAAHRNTPPEILRELYRKPRSITGLDIWFAGNPSTPKEILSDLAGTTRQDPVISQLTENPSVDCAILSKLAKTLMNTLKRDADDRYVARLSERVPEVCASARESGKSG